MAGSKAVTVRILLVLESCEIEIHQLNVYLCRLWYIFCSVSL